MATKTAKRKKPAEPAPGDYKSRPVFGLDVEHSAKLRQLADRAGVPQATLVEQLIDVFYQLIEKKESTNGQ